MAGNTPDASGRGHQDRWDRSVDVHIDIGTAEPARFVDYLGGGDSHFEVDRKAVEELATAVPGGVETGRSWEAAMVAFHKRVVHYLVNEAGIRQFLVLDVRLPGPNSVHTVAQRIAPESRAVYLVTDPTALAHAHELRPVTPEGETDFVLGRFDAPDELLHAAARTLDLDQPVAVMLMGVLVLIPDELAQPIIRTLVDGVPSGSQLLITAMANDVQPVGLADAVAPHDKLVEEGKMPRILLRSHEETCALLDGLELVEPGVVPVAEWHREQAGAHSAENLYAPTYGALGRKP